MQTDRNSRLANETLLDTHDRPVSADADNDPFGIYALQQHEFVTYRISVLSRIFDRLADRRMLKKRGLSLTDSRVLGHLYVSRQATVRGLAEEMHMHRPQISRAMSTLVRRGYARKKSDPKDRRSAVFTISAKGSRLHEDMMDGARERQLALSDLLGLKKYNELNATLGRLIETFGPQDKNLD